MPLCQLKRMKRQIHTTKSRLETLYEVFGTSENAHPQSSLKFWERIPEVLFWTRPSNFGVSLKGVV